jgi:Fic family protein
MAERVKLKWQADRSRGLTRAARSDCEYEAYIPDFLSDHDFRIAGETAAQIAEAEQQVAALNTSRTALVDSESMSRLLLRAEAVASSRIEGLEVGGRRLLKAQLAGELRIDAGDVTAIEVMSNIEAMRWGIDRLGGSEAIRVDGLLEVHRRLMAGSRLEAHGGQIRDEQNWIGGSEYNPCRADFVPPPPHRVADLLEDLAEFCNSETLPPLVQAAIAHAQFETVHPFVDGNGRTGRILIHAILRRRGLAPITVPPISLVLATWSREYVGGLTATRYEGPSDSPQARSGLDQWIGFFAEAALRSVADAGTYNQRVSEIQVEWRRAIGKVRSGSSVDLILRALPAAPLLTVKTAAGLTGRSEQAANEAIRRLIDAGVLSQTTVGRRNRAFEAPEMVEALTDLERQLASPRGNTRSSPPRRRVPARRR